MRKIREVLCLKHLSQLTCREIAQSCGVARSTVSDYLARAAAVGLSWPLPESLTDEELDARLFRRAVINGQPRPLPDYAAIDEELRRHRRVNLTLDLLWREYKEQHPEGYQYTHFVALYHRWHRQRDRCLRQVHRYGEKVFVDFADGLSLIDPQLGTSIPTALFVAVWGASNYHLCGGLSGSRAALLDRGARSSPRVLPVCSPHCRSRQFTRGGDQTLPI